MVDIILSTQSAIHHGEQTSNLSGCTPNAFRNERPLMPRPLQNCPVKISGFRFYLLCVLEAVEDRLWLLGWPEVMRHALPCMLEGLKVLDVLEFRRYWRWYTKLQVTGQRSLLCRLHQSVYDISSRAVDLFSVANSYTLLRLFQVLPW